LPDNIDTTQNYLFYLHGQLVTDRGNNAVNQSFPQWGPYEYLNILDSLEERGFIVVSEIRKKGVKDEVYEQKIIRQIDTLLKAGVPEERIVIVGASSGWSVALNVSSQISNNRLGYVLIGGCWPNTYKEYTSKNLHGRFLSIIEKSDPHGTCAKIFEGKNGITDFREIMLNTGLNHGFFHKGSDVWIDPIVDWMGERR
jgi:hypothetical protein